ncbi:MAG: PAS domain S-box protein [Brevundimonas sp.]|uniref:PAS domain S-box protein n=1 Tax=Brevundimonas sp. TaxID=1871086 RepID=UPI0025C06FF8|nr:PAS domain S-box protein [Brevundimonas sp.]MBX3478382.1 PAS domain S-box protein [Brevundimonas sp.]
MGALASLRRAVDFEAGLARLARRPLTSPLHSLATGLAWGVAAILVRWAASGFYGSISGFMILLPGVILAALAGGRIAGFAAMAACLVGAQLLLGSHVQGVGLWDRLGVVATVNFLLIGAFVTLVSAALGKALRRLDEALRARSASDARAEETEDRLTAFSEFSPALLWMSDTAGACIHLNKAQREFWGVGDQGEFDFSTTLHPDDRDRVVAQSIAATQAAAALVTEARYRHASGDWRVLRTEAQPRFAPDGAFLGLIGVNTDVTQARAAEAALRESESRFRLMADRAPSPVWLTGVKGDVEFANTALAEFYGVPATRILGHGWKQSLHPDDLDAVNAVQARARPQHQPYDFEARFRRADGAWRWMRVAVKPRQDTDGRFLGYVGMSFDVTDTRDALDALAVQGRRQAFLLSLNDRIRDLSDPEEVMVTVEEQLGAELGVQRVGYGEVDQDQGIVANSRDWTSGVASAQGRFSLHAFGAQLLEDLAKGRTVAIADIGADPRTVPVAQAFKAIETRAIIRAPLIRGGRLRAFLYVHAAAPRQWTAAEIRLVEEVAARTWAEVERARAELAVRESEQRFRAVADTAPVLIWVTGPDRVREFVNQAYVAYNGGTYEEARLADWRAVIHPDDQDRVLSESLAGEATREPFSMEARYLRHDGEYRWLKSFSRPRLGPGDQVLGFVGVAFDVTEMREAEHRIAESEARFRTVADSAPAIIWMSDELFRIVFGNRRYKSFFGVRSDQRLSAAWRRLIHPRDLSRFERAFSKAHKVRDRFEAVVRVNHPTQGERWLRTEGVPRYDAAGLFRGYVGATIDVTDAKRAEDDLKRINELLEERVGEALAEKAKAEADLMHAQRLEAVGRLTGGVAHDFNNLLTVVIGALDMILRSPDDAARRKKLGEAALAAARRGERLTHQLLAFSRRQALRPEIIDLNGLIREGEPLLRRAVGEAVEFRLKLRRGGARVNVDPAQFEAALLNLIVNARDALADGGRITVQSLNCEIGEQEATDIPAGDYVCVTVTDNGDGIPPEIIDRVFDPFFTTKSVGKGTGLGLSQVYGFARQSGGGVQITSTPGEGTEIRLFLPRLKNVRPGRAAAPRAEATSARIVAGRRILLVEDDPAVGAVAVDMLKSMGLEVTAAETAPQALDLLEQGAFDMMLTDIVMPGGMSGVELARRASERYPAMRIVLTSGYAGDDVDETLKDAPWPFLAKPYSADQLRRLLHDGATPY